MDALVVFESMFGNTQAIANAVAEGLSTRMSVVTAEVGGAPKVLAEDVELLVVGGPTHAFGMSRRTTRRSAAEQAEGVALVSTGIGMREWLAALKADAGSVGAAVFDTRAAKPRLPGSAAKAGYRRLRRLGFRMVARPENFYVEGVKGPLASGELDRARRWGETLGSDFTVREGQRYAR